jgi:hypothetical protein
VLPIAQEVEAVLELVTHVHQLADGKSSILAALLGPRS